MLGKNQLKKQLFGQKNVENAKVYDQSEVWQNSI